MKLSEAIRLGAMLRPQAFGDAQQVGSCALKAACDALGVEGNSIWYLNYAALSRIYPFILTPYPTCAFCGIERWEIMSMIWHLNDYHKWTREEIADWVATVEPQEEVSSGSDQLAQPTVCGVSEDDPCPQAVA